MKIIRSEREQRICDIIDDTAPRTVPFVETIRKIVEKIEGKKISEDRIRNMLYDSGLVYRIDERETGMRIVFRDSLVAWDIEPFGGEWRITSLKSAGCTWRGPGTAAALSYLIKRKGYVADERTLRDAFSWTEGSRERMFCGYGDTFVAGERIKSEWDWDLGDVLDGSILGGVRITDDKGDEVAVLTHKEFHPWRCGTKEPGYICGMLLK